jgi:hypothetical protein
MATFNKYEMYCETDGWVQIISDTEPTQCPIDGAHSIKAISLIKENIQVNDGTLTNLNLNDYKKLRFKEIDIKTGELISQGFVYNSKIFSLSNNAQLNLLGVDIKRNDGILPLTFNTIDDMDDITFTDPAELDNFFMTALGSKKTHLDSGSALKLSIRNAASHLEVDAIIDNR